MRNIIVKVHPSKSNLKKEDQLAWKIAEIASDKAIIDKITPQVLWAKRPAVATIPTIEAGQARLIAKQKFAVCSGGPEPTTNAIKGIANTLQKNPIQVRVQ